MTEYCHGYHTGGYTFDMQTALWVCATCGLPTTKYYQTIIEFRSDKEHKFVMATKTADVATFVNALQKFLAEFAAEHGIPPFMPADIPTPARAKKAAAASKVAPEPEEEEEEESTGGNRKAQLNAMSIAELRKACVKAGYPKDEVASASKADLVATLMEEDEEEPDEDVEDDETEADQVEEESDAEEGEAYTREDFEGLGLRELQRIAREEYGYVRKDYAGMDKDTLISFLLGEDEDAEDEEEPEEDEDSDGYTEEDLNEMSIGELRALAKENGIKMKVGMSKASIIKALMEE